MFGNAAESILAAIWPCCCMAGNLLAARSLIHWFQLESYQFPGYFRTLRRQGVRSWIPGGSMALAAAVVILAGRAAAGRIPGWLFFLLLDAALPVAGWGLRAWGLRQKEKKKLVFTPRIRRLYAVCAVLWLILLYAALRPLTGVLAGSLSDLLIACGFCLALPLWVALGGLLAWPIEKAISEMYFRDAQRILRERPDLIKIGITGSWGKTSVKFILGTLLSEKYPTLVTPASFNTPMGVTKVIRTQLEPGHAHVCPPPRNQLETALSKGMSFPL